jgi:flagella basal body P-ring formation protein FlgA
MRMKAVNGRRYRVDAVLVLSLAAAGMLATVRRTPSRAVQPPPVGVLFAARDLPKSSVIRAKDLRLTLIPRALADAIPGALLAKPQVIGLSTFYPIQRGQLLTASDLASPARYLDVQPPFGLRDTPLDWPLRQSNHSAWASNHPSQF